VAVYKNDIGTTIRVDTGFDLTAATRTDLIVMKPNKNETVWTGAPSSAGATLIDYVVGIGDLDFVGDYLLQAYVELPGWSGRGITTTLVVKDYYE